MYIFSMIIIIAILILYTYPILLFIKIIVDIVAGKYTDNTNFSYKELKKSVLFLILDGILWFPVVLAGMMSTDAPSTGNFHISMVNALMYVPIVAILCVCINSIIILRNRIKSKN